MDLLRNIGMRVAVGVLVVIVSLGLHFALGPKNPIGMIAIYLFFVGFAWAGAKFLVPFLGKAFLYAIPDALIPPLILIPLKNTAFSEEWWRPSLLIGVLMVLYSTFMVGWMLQAYDRAQGSSAPTPAA